MMRSYCAYRSGPHFEKCRDERRVLTGSDARYEVRLEEDSLQTTTGDDDGTQRWTEEEKSSRLLSWYAVLADPERP